LNAALALEKFQCGAFRRPTATVDEDDFVGFRTVNQNESVASDAGTAGLNDCAGKAGGHRRIYGVATLGQYLVPRHGSRIVSRCHHAIHPEVHGPPRGGLSLQQSDS
jgi:hypothetical protein